MKDSLSNCNTDCVIPKNTTQDQPCNFSNCPWAYLYKDYKDQPFLKDCYTFCKSFKPTSQLITEQEIFITPLVIPQDPNDPLFVKCQNLYNYLGPNWKSDESISAYCQLCPQDKTSTFDVGKCTEQVKSFLANCMSISQIGEPCENCLDNCVKYVLANQNNFYAYKTLFDLHYYDCLICTSTS